MDEEPPVELADELAANTSSCSKRASTCRVWSDEPPISMGSTIPPLIVAMDAPHCKPVVSMSVKPSISSISTGNRATLSLSPRAERMLQHRQRERNTRKKDKKERKQERSEQQARFALNLVESLVAGAVEVTYPI